MIVDEITLLHFVKKAGRNPILADEYIALIEDGEDTDDYIDDDYTISCVCDVIPVKGNANQLPTGRTFKEE